jgi:3-methylcrotonyl-CoA carboxylase alpha subunit
MFKKILIANRGEIACRVAATARRLGVRTVAVYSEADARAKHVAFCDEAVAIGGPAPKDSYLRWERILQAARDTGAQAVHPGYGFLSENEAFAQACADAGIAFIGPKPSSILAMGLKAESKRLMEQAGVPLVPGYHGADQDPALLRREADRIGYPVLIKASAGGGGKGMRIVESGADFEAALASCQREARNSFGDDAVLIEKYVQRPRHIEIQVFGDSHGQVVHLFERDCSVQRRHQKVLEESPAPGLSAELRERMGAAAVAAAKAVDYVGAGTVEFIVEQTDYDQPESMKFYFMEMNTRLQVEHPVTEAVTGLDLVEWQLRVASGEPLPLRQDQIVQRGHAIEARICAENPDNQFLPSTGTLQVYRKPQALAFERGVVRFDDGVREGDAISPFYDSMIAKLIVHGDDRQQALARLDMALSQTRIVGLATNVQFLRRVLDTDSFARARLDTALITREHQRLFEHPGVSSSLALAAATAQAWLAEQAGAAGAEAAWADPWARRDGFQPHAPSQRRWAWQVGGQRVDTVLNTGLAPSLAVDDAPALPFVAQEQDGRLDITWGEQRYTAQVHVWGEQVHVFLLQGALVVERVEELAHAGEQASAGGQLTAPMPGKVLSFAVKAGDAVKAGQPVAVMEAMKMEHTLHAPADGRVTELLYAPGDQVTDGAELLRIEVTSAE